MGILRRIDFSHLREIYRTPSSDPIYVLNLLDYADFAMYRWYGFFVFPMILSTGGGVPWMGRWKQSIHGEPICGSILMVRYRNHQRFLIMTVNPLWLAINAFREKGVARFEASFSKAHMESRGRRWSDSRLLGIHFNAVDSEEALLLNRECLASMGGEEVLAAEEYLAMDFLKDPAPNDPNPLTYKVNQFFRIPEGALSAHLVEGLEKRAAQLGSCSIQLYAQSNPRHYLPGAPIPKYLLEPAAGKNERGMGSEPVT